MLSSRTSRVYLDEEDMGGAARLFAEAAEHARSDYEDGIYTGVAMVFSILSDTDRIQYPKDLLTIFDARVFGRYGDNDKETA